MSGAFFKKLPFKNKNKIWGGLSWSKQGCSMWGAPGFHEERSQLSRATIYTAQLGAAYAE